MDFVEPPFGGEGVEVPLVSATVMRPDDDEWYSFATRLDLSQSQEEIAEFIQSWLYFGLLAVLADITIDGREYSTPGKRGSTIVSSHLVAATLVEMKLGVLRLPQSECMSVLEKHKTILVRADEAVRRTEEHFTSRTSGLVDLILLSVKVLIGTIVHSYDSVVDHMFEKLCGTTIQWYDLARRRRGPSKAADRALEAKMMENGWCVHQIDKILSTFSYQTAYYFARLPRPRSARLGHDRCSKASCKGWDSKPGDTSACHATDNCTCSTVSVSSVEVAKIIRSNQIPLISIEEDVHGALSLKLHTKTRSSKYVAISHVWADGLGNAFENGLPTCQLRMLQTYLGQISKDRPTTWSNYVTSPTTTLFWMDTLCIPVQVAPPGIPFSDQDLREIKGKAIDKMNIVYSSSSHTLVLDAELREIPVSSDNPTKLAYSLSCGWTTRSWTLQEGCLPPLTVYALADGIYSHETRQFGQRFSMGKLNYAIRFAYILAKKRFTAPKFVMAARGLTPEIVAQDFEYPVHRDIYTSFATRNFNIWDSAYSLVLSGRNMLHSRNKYAEIWNELLDRSSSQPADIPAIFANLIGISAYEVLKRDSEEKRVALIIRQQTVLPVEILYNTGPRLRGRLHAQRVPTIRQTQEPLDLQDDVAEESIGLLNVSEPEVQVFKNGWVPATIDGDAISQSLSSTKLHLQVLKNRLQVRNGDKEYFPCMFSTTDVNIPTSEFLLKRTSKCQKDKEIAVTRVIDPSTLNDSQGVEETVQGHCFIYDSGSLRAMSLGLIDDAPGAHMVIIGRSKERLTLRYSEPIRFTRITRKRQNFGTLPVVECQCNIHESKQFVDIIYGKLLTHLSAHATIQAYAQSRCRRPRTTTRWFDQEP